MPNHSGDAIVFGNYWGFTVMDTAGALMFDVGGVSDGIQFAGWMSETELIYLQGGALHRFDVRSRTETGWWQAPPLGDAGLAVGWDAATGKVLLADEDAFHRFDPATGADDVTPLAGRTVTAMSVDGARVLLAVGVSLANQVWDSQLEQSLYEAQPGASLSFATNGDVVERPADGSQVRLLGLDGGVTVQLEAGGARDGNASAFSKLPVGPDRAVYLTTETRGFVKFRSLTTNQEWGQLPLELFQDDTTGEWAYAGFSGDGRRVALISLRKQGGTWEPVLTVVDLAPATMTHAVCESVRRGLEAAEWRGLTGREPSGPLACQP